MVISCSLQPISDISSSEIGPVLVIAPRAVIDPPQVQEEEQANESKKCVEHSSSLSTIISV
jgi:hypothetical protein